jgi:hypothetical protein
MEPPAQDVVHAALDALLQVVEKSAEDLHLFHETVSRASLEPLPPFPRTTVAVTERIIERLTAVDGDLEEVLIALGLKPTPG